MNTWLIIAAMVLIGIIGIVMGITIWSILVSKRFVCYTVSIPRPIGYKTEVIYVGKDLEQEKVRKILSILADGEDVTLYDKQMNIIS